MPSPPNTARERRRAIERSRQQQSDDDCSPAPSVEPIEPPDHEETDRLLASARAHREKGNDAEAVAEMRRYLELRQRHYGEERKRAIAEMQERFDVERAERQREEYRVRSEHLAQMMEQRQRELTSMAMQLVRKNAFLQRLRAQAADLAREESTGTTALDALIEEISVNLSGDADWQRFQREFENVHRDFLATLSERCPKLSPTELRVCALLKINLSNKEIADLLAVTLRNVESHRYSIRKKLMLPSEVNLAAWMASFGAESS
jgi:AraC family transcriptional regulator, chitin signaling transcriptional activator